MSYKLYTPQFRYFPGTLEVAARNFDPETIYNTHWDQLPSIVEGLGEVLGNLPERIVFAYDPTVRHVMYDEGIEEAFEIEMGKIPSSLSCPREYVWHPGNGVVYISTQFPMSETPFCHH